MEAVWSHRAHDANHHAHDRAHVFVPLEEYSMPAKICNAVQEATHWWHVSKALLHACQIGNHVPACAL